MYEHFDIYLIYDRIFFQTFKWIFKWNRDKIKILLENVIEKIVKYNKNEVFMSNLGDVGSWTQIIQLGFGLWPRAWGFGWEREKPESKEEYLLE